MRPSRLDLVRHRAGLIVRATLAGKAAIAQMADDLRVLSASAGHITTDDMELLGWTPQQLNTLGAAARRQAQAWSLASRAA